MTEFLRQSPDIIPAQNWVNEARRKELEARLGAYLADVGFKFDNEGERSGSRRLLNTGIVCDALVSRMNREDPEGDGPGLRAFAVHSFAHSDGSFSEGLLILGAPTRDVANGYQAEFAARVNTLLEGLEAGFRLAENS